MMDNISVVCFLASYTVAFGLELSRLLRRTAINRGIMLLFAAAGLLAHTLYLFMRSEQADLPPLLSSTHDWMLVLAWLGVVLYLFLATFDRNLPVGLFLLPLVLLLIGTSYFVSSEPNRLVTQDGSAREAAIYGWGMLHASLLVLGTGGVILGFVLSLMYLVQHYRLKHKQTLQNGLRLPNLEKLSRLNWWAVMISVPLLTMGMAIGVVLGAVSQREAAWVTFSDPVVIVNGVVWVVMMVFFVWLLLTRRPAGRQVALRTMWAFGFLLVTLIILQVLTSGGAVSLKTWHTQVPPSQSFVEFRS